MAQTTQTPGTNTGGAPVVINAAPPTTVGSSKYFIMIALIGALIIVALGVMTAARWMKSAVPDVNDTTKSSPQPPPPSDKLPNAPGPDNTVQQLQRPANVPLQPPSPIKSETDPNKKPKEP
jgi:cell division septation protein DedD